MKIDGVIFDMDGVLVDVSKSYRFAIEKTVNYFLAKLKVMHKTSQEDINVMKEISGFNNDWDLSYELIRLLEIGIRNVDFPKRAKIVPIKKRETKKYQIIKDIFQIYYLGKEIYKKLYKRYPLINSSKGLINQESLLLGLDIIGKLFSKYKLGVATSRPRFEALYALQRLQITPKYIEEKYIVAQEDVKREKPFPDPILEAKKRMKVENPIYVGDSINDCIAAKSAGMKCIFIGIRKLGDYQINNVNKIKDLLL